MFRPFHLKRPIDSNASMDPDEVLATKRALVDLGFMDLPDYGLTPHPDRAMIEGIKVFQSRHGLHVDGIMKPDGLTLKRLNESLVARAKEIGLPPEARPTVLGLTDEVGFQKKNKPHDVFSTRQTLSWAGHPPRESALDSDGLANAIMSFQRAAGLKIDGFLRPHGETERALNKTLAGTVRALQQQAVSGDGKSVGSEGRLDQQAFAPAVVPPIVLKIAEFFGIAVMAAWAWWQSMSAAEKDRVRRQVSGGGPSDDGGNRDECDRLHYEVDIPTCNAVSDKRGKQAAQRCYASANERYAACLRGVPLNRLPPLDIWNN